MNIEDSKEIKCQFFLIFWRKNEEFRKIIEKFPKMCHFYACQRSGKFWKMCQFYACQFYAYDCMYIIWLTYDESIWRPYTFRRGPYTFTKNRILFEMDRILFEKDRILFEKDRIDFAKDRIVYAGTVYFQAKTVYFQLGPYTFQDRILSKTVYFTFQDRILYNLIVFWTLSFSEIAFFQKIRNFMILRNRTCPKNKEFCVFPKKTCPKNKEFHEKWLLNRFLILGEAVYFGNKTVFMYISP